MLNELDISYHERPYRKPRRAASYKRVGGIRFLQIGRLTVTMSVRNPANHIGEYNRPKWAFVGLPSLSTTLALACCIVPIDLVLLLTGNI